MHAETLSLVSLTCFTFALGVAAWLVCALHDRAVSQLRRWNASQPDNVWLYSVRLQAAREYISRRGLDRTSYRVVEG